MQYAVKSVNKKLGLSLTLAKRAKMINYKIVLHIGGKFRLVRFLNGVISFVNTNKKYFKTEEAARQHATLLVQNDNRKQALKKRNPGLIVNL